MTDDRIIPACRARVDARPLRIERAPLPCPAGSLVSDDLLAEALEIVERDREELAPALAA